MKNSCSPFKKQSNPQPIIQSSSLNCNIFMVLSHLWSLLLALRPQAEAWGLPSTVYLQLNSGKYITSIGTAAQPLVKTNIEYQPIKWRKLGAFRHVYKSKTTCWSSNWTSEWGIKVPLTVAWLFVAVWVFQKLIWSSGIFPTQPSLGLTENGLKMRKSQVSSSSLDENTLLMPKQNGQTADMKATATQITTC